VLLMVNIRLMSMKDKGISTTGILDVNS